MIADASRSVRDSGSGTVVMVAVVSVAMTVALSVSTFAKSVVHDVKAQSIADAVALAGVAGSRIAAERTAAANDAEMTDFDVQWSDSGDSTVFVTVSVGGRSARAWASDAG